MRPRHVPCPPQNATWALGAPLVSMLYGLRLVFAILEQKAVLGTTVMGVNPGLQISGACLSVAAVSFYMYSQWRRSRQAQQQGV